MIRKMAVVLVMAACGGGDPATIDASIEDQPIIGDDCATAPSYVEEVADCTPLATDYQPREASDSWAACISDDDTYHRIEESISSIARVEAFDAIGELLWAAGAAPTHDDFLSARVLFEEEQGLGSRVARRYDPHYPPPAEGSCDDAEVAAANPDYCVGPALLQPLVVTAFAAGSLGQERLVSAAKIEAALQWFLYVSAIKEATSCADTPKDCDSAWAYYSGGTPRNNPIGLAGDIDAYAPETHDRGYDGVLAIRCWRDLDQAVPAENLALQEQAIDQLDVAMLRGIAILVRQRFAALECSTGDYQQAALEGLRILVPLLDRETRFRDSLGADKLLAEIAEEPAVIDVAGAIEVLDSVYPCP